MSLFQKVKHEILANKQLREEGKDLVIPWLNFPRLSERVPGVQRGRYIIITAASKVGKTQIADSLYVMEPLAYIKEHNTNIKPKIYYFSLEISKEEKIAQLISNKIYQDTKIAIPPDKLRSYYRGYIAEDWIKDILQTEAYADYFDFLEGHIEFVDYIRNPTGIYFYMREVARQRGKFYYKGKEVKIPENADWSNKAYWYDEYIPDDPDDLIIVLTDHISLLEQEKGMKDIREAMGKYSSVYCLRMRDSFKFCVVNIQQQALDSDKPEYNRDGKLIVEKLRPSTDGFGDMKLSVRDVDLVLGLFNPSKFRAIKEFMGYDVSQWGNHFRELSIIINRRGDGDLSLPLYFDGAVNYFSELPEAEDFKKNPRLYNTFLPKN